MNEEYIFILRRHSYFAIAKYSSESVLKFHYPYSTFAESNSLTYQLRYYFQEPDGGISYACSRYTNININIIIVIVFIIIIIILVITFMQGMYNYIPETNHVSRL